MKPCLRRCRFALLLLLLFLLAALPARAADAPFDPAAWSAEDPCFCALGWEDLISAFLQRHGLDAERVGLFYYNTVTGEARDWNGDQYFTAASTYKVPINLVFADKVSRGEMTLDEPIGGVPLRNIQFNTLRSSDNSQGELLIEHLGTYTQYKAAMTPYLCPPGEELDPAHLLENAFTPRQMAYALRLLYDAPERFPEVLDHMLLAQPDSYFRQNERRFPIAHKYGYYADLGFRACNDIGIVWTHEPVILVMMTDAVNGGPQALADYCVLMCEYSEYWHARHLEQEAQARIAGEMEEAAWQEAEAQFRAEALAKREAEERAQAQQEAEARRLAAEAEGARRELPNQKRLHYAAITALLGLLTAALLWKRRPARYLAAAVLVLALLGVLWSAYRNLWSTEAAEAEPVQTEETAAPTPEPSPEPTPEPTPTPEPVYELRLGPEDAGLLSGLAEAHPELRHVDGTALADYALLADLQRALPDCDVEYAVPLGTLSVSSRETQLRLEAESGVTAEELLEKLDFLPRLRRLDITALDFGNAATMPIADRYPELDLVWIVRFGNRWTVRSDITCFSTLQSWPPAYRYTDEDLAPLLRYCKHLAALDLGHNALRDLSPLAGLTELKVLILGDNGQIADLTPLANLTHLEYMELFMADWISDFTPLSHLTEMVDLCVGYCGGLRDISFVEQMPRLQMGWFPGDPLSDAQREAAKAARSETTFLFFPSLVSSTSDGWRMTERNVEIRRAFCNWEHVLAFRSWDDVDYEPGAALVPVWPLKN